ncbi:MAG TPA: FHA domain-containing protein, partial [Polyangiaceae bacterium]|nr:FHA domain-containing protein [Polyangiaceae bacterium]
MPFRLRHLQHDFELGLGEFAIGRSPECQLSLDDPLVSRKHALLVVSPESVLIKDLGSRNGVVVNGTKIDTSRVLLDGDRIVIGSQEMTIMARPATAGPQYVRRSTTGAQTLSSYARPHSLEPTKLHTEPIKELAKDTKRVDSFPLLSTLADKALALGRPEDAERILSSLMLEVLNNAQRGDVLPAETVDQAALYGVRLAGATS